MNKNDFLLAVHEYLKAFGYRKNKSYWFLSNGELVYCVYVQSSQWDANDYYVEVGIAIEEIVGPKPSVTRWYVRKRCEDESQNDRNISLSVLKQAIDFFSDILTVNDLTLYLERTPHTLVGLQYLTSYILSSAELLSKLLLFYAKNKKGRDKMLSRFFGAVTGGRLNLRAGAM